MLKRICGILLACGLLAACSGAGTQPTVIPEAAAPSEEFPVTTMSITPRISHITVVIMENYDYEQIIGNAAAPYTNQLARANTLFTNSHAVSHPSEPNYLALFSGSTHGVTSDYCPMTFYTQNLGSELLAHGHTFEGYADDWPSSGNPCYGAYSSTVGSHYLYWRKHVPWADFSNFAYRTYGHNYYGAGTPLTGSVNFVIPNICHDMHDCSVAAGDSWLAHNIPAIQSYDSTHNGLLIVTFDEASDSTSNHIVTIMSGAMMPKGLRTTWINHYSVLRFIESNFGLPLLGYSYGASIIAL